MAVQQTLMNPGWVTDPTVEIDYAVPKGHRWRVNQRPMIKPRRGPGDDRTFAGMTGTVVAVEPGGRWVELCIVDGPNVFHTAQHYMDLEGNPQ